MGSRVLKVGDADSYYKGKRLKNGWKNAGIRWTYALDPDLMYLVDESPKPAME